MEKTKKNDFVEITYTGYANNQIFDSNIEEDFKILDPKEKPKKIIVCIGQGMLLEGLDNALENKELNKEYEISIPSEDAFGKRKRELIRTIPLAAFKDQKVNPQPGMLLALDHHVVKIIAVSGARITADFNNPLAGKDIRYKFTITRKVTDAKEKTESFFEFFLRYIPKFEINSSKVVVRGPELLDAYITAQKQKFKELIGLELDFKPEEKEKKESPVRAQK